MKYLLLIGLVFAAAPRDPLDKALKTIKKDEIKVNQTYLASDALEGREAGSKGGHTAGEYIAAHFKKCGLKPGGDEGTYFQGFERDGKPGDIKRGKVEDASTLKIERAEPVKLQPIEGSPEGSFDGPIVFAGYGITAPDLKYDDYEGLTVKGSIVLVMDHEPQETLETSAFDGAKLSKYGEWAHKIQNAADHGAEAILIALDPLNHPKDEMPAVEFKWPGEGKPTLPLPAAYLSKRYAEGISKQASKALDSLQRTIDEKLKPAGYTLKKTIDMTIAARGPVVEGMKNVVGIWEGSDAKLKEEYIVIGAHYDHIGMGNFGSNGSRGKIHNGSDDNASGTSAILEIAEALAEVQWKRSVILISFDAEEKGLWGSKAFVEEPSSGWPIEKCKAMINMDMLSRNETTLVNVGMTDKSCDPFLKALSAAEKKFKFTFDRRGADDYVKRSDQWNFAEKGVPAIFLFGGMHEDYHKETDDIEKSNFQKIELIARTALYVGERMANWTGAWK